VGLGVVELRQSFGGFGGCCDGHDDPGGDVHGAWPWTRSV